jgi:hypothetical protein|tara:strand:- start:989 stop:1501 length:513 start_codon:yes stop_codon:yes gene_type:complete
MFAVLIGSVALSIATGSIMALAKGSESLINYTEMNTQSRVALQLIGRQIRSAADVVSASSSTLTVDCIEGDGSTTRNAYVYSSTNKTLTVTSTPAGGSSVSNVLLNDINYLAFDYFTLRHVTTTAPLEIKHVQLEAELLRNVLAQTNRNHIISARFMLRNKRVSNQAIST